MAQRRMFSKSITNSSKFLMMPASSQNLYFHLGMNADDDGFCEHFSLMRMTDSKPDDLKILQAKEFVKVFDDSVLIITDWKENNYLRNDRYTPSKYLEIYREELLLISTGSTINANEIKEIDSGIPNGNQMDTQVRLGKDRKGKVSKEKTNTSGEPQAAEVIKLFESVDPKNKTYYGNKTQRAASEFLLKEYGIDKIQKIVAVLPKTNCMEFYPIITTPWELKEKWSKLVTAMSKSNDKQQDNFLWI